MPDAVCDVTAPVAFEIAHIAIGEAAGQGFEPQLPGPEEDPESGSIRL
jgi:hypothetical protein